MKAVAVFCGSKLGNSPNFENDAEEVAAGLAQAGIRIIYGGGNKGLMGAVANAALAHQGTVIGIIPEHLRAFEHQHERITQLVVVPDMHTRKKMMYEMCEAAIILPGGYGTMDEMFEMLTWNQLSIHDKPIFILNTDGFYDSLLQLLEQMAASNFLHTALHDRVHIFNKPALLIKQVLSK